MAKSTINSDFEVAHLKPQAQVKRIQHSITAFTCTDNTITLHTSTLISKDNDWKS